MKYNKKNFLKAVKCFDEEEFFCFSENESSISENDFMMELKHALRQYFLGMFRYENGSILYLMPNGQRFKIKVEKL